MSIKLNLHSNPKASTASNFNYAITVPKNIQISTIAPMSPRANAKASNNFLSDAWNSLVECSKNLWNRILSCFGIKNQTGSPFTKSYSLTVNPSQYAHRISNPNKLFVYNRLTQGRSVGNQVTASKWSVNSQPVETSPLFNPKKTPMVVVPGTFRYDASTANTVHWTANFADSNLFGFCEGPLLAQDEQQVAEHPALAHIKAALTPEQRTLHRFEAALFQNVPRLGALDTTTPLAGRVPPQTLYGNVFAGASQLEIQSRLTQFNNPVGSNIFAIEAPKVPLALKDQPYQRKDLETLFFTFKNFLLAMKETCPGAKNVVHTGNWGCGAWGNDPKTVYLMTLAATRSAGTADELRMHPLGNNNELQAAVQLLAQIEQQHPGMTDGQFLDHVAANAATYGLRYKQGNGT